MKNHYIFAIAVASGLLFLCCSVSMAENTLTPTILLEHSTAYDGQHVTVKGEVRNIESKTSHRGNAYEIFKLCDESCVSVFTWGNPKLSEGQAETVRGTFSVDKHVGQYIFHNEIEADDSSL